MTGIALSFAPDIAADPTTAALMERRVADGEIDVAEIRAILRGDYASETVYSHDGYNSPSVRFVNPAMRRTP